jgi:hypothetical protein
MPGRQFLEIQSARTMFFWWKGVFSAESQYSRYMILPDESANVFITG